MQSGFDWRALNIYGKMWEGTLRPVLPRQGSSASRKSPTFQFQSCPGPLGSVGADSLVLGVSSGQYFLLCTCSY